MMEKWKNRSIRTRNDAAEAFLDIIRPLKTRYSKGHAWLYVGDTAAHYGEKDARMEGFARILWGLGPLWSQDNSGLPDELQKEADWWLTWYREGIIHGTDPQHEEYWGEVLDFDQKMVEMAALVTAISLSPDKLWEPLTEKEKDNLYQWLNQINSHHPNNNNWRYFRILVNMMFRLLDLPWSEEAMKDDRSLIEASYTGNGWYFDGKPERIDYYGPFAIHFYGLLYAKFMESEDSQYSRILKERSDRFSRDFIYWFSNDGNEVPIGRSLTYRFAHGAFFAAMGFAEVKGAGYGVMKHLALKNLEIWLKRPIFDASGVLTIGYGYPNLFMSESYNSPGSPYWSLKIFFLLAMAENHPFWKAEEELVPYEGKKYLPDARMLVTHDKNNHVMIYPAGLHCHNLGYSAEKYEKFVYSNQFGFSVPRGSGLKEGAFDCTLAISYAGEEHYRMRYGFESYEVSEEGTCVSYRMMPGVSVESRVIPCGPWHVRIHKIHTEHDIDIADGGFAIESQPSFRVVSGAKSGKYTAENVEITSDSAAVHMPWGISAVVSLTGGSAELVDTFPNTNLFHPLTVIPTIRQTLGQGDHMVVTCVMGDRSPEAEHYLKQVPDVYLDGQEWKVRVK